MKPLRVVKWMARDKRESGTIIAAIVKENVTYIVICGDDGFIHEIKAADIRPC